MFRLNVETDGAAFKDPDTGEADRAYEEIEISRIMRKMCIRDRVKHHVAVRIKFVRSVISAYGWFKNTNMVKYRIRNKVDELMRIARKIASDHDKGNGYVEKKYFNMWRRYYACLLYTSSWKIAGTFE